MEVLEAIRTEQCQRPKRASFISTVGKGKNMAKNSGVNALNGLLSFLLP